MVKCFEHHQLTSQPPHYHRNTCHKASFGWYQPVERVFLLDSMSHIFRAFFAPMANRAAPSLIQGPGNASLTSLQTCCAKLLQDEKPNYIAAIFESGEKTFATETFADYKAKRLAMPEDLASQLPYIRRLCRSVEYSGDQCPRVTSGRRNWHACRKVAEQKLQAVIVSNDKDMCQLVADPYVVCMRTNSQVVKRKEYVPPIEWCDEAGREELVWPASKVVDLLV